MPTALGYQFIAIPTVSDQCIAFFLAFPEVFGTDGIRVWDMRDDASVYKASCTAIDAQVAMEAIRAKGTDPKILLRWHEKLGVTVKVFNGNREVHSIGGDVDGQLRQQVVVLNFWSGHVFGYDPAAGALCVNVPRALKPVPTVRLRTKWDEDKRV